MYEIPAADEIGRWIGVLESIGYCVLKAGDAQTRDVHMKMGLREIEAHQTGGTMLGFKDVVKRSLAAKLGNVLLDDGLLRWSEALLVTGGVGCTLAAAIVVPDIRIGKTWPPQRR